MDIQCCESNTLSVLLKKKQAQGKNYRIESVNQMSDKISGNRYFDCFDQIYKFVFATRF